MFSGKTETLIKTAIDLENAGAKYIAIKPTIDTRQAGNIIKSRASNRSIKAVSIDPFQADQDIISLIQAQKFLNIFIDEIQFFDKFSLLATITYLSIFKDMNIYLYGLNFDYKNKIYDINNYLIGIIDLKIDLKSECYLCGCAAEYTKRLIRSDKEIIIDDNIYVAACQEHK